MRHQVGWKLHSDDQINRLPIRLGQVEQAPGQRPADDLGWGIPLKWQRHHLSLVAAYLESSLEAVDVRLRTTAGERNLCGANKDVADRHGVEVRSPESAKIF